MNSRRRPSTRNDQGVVAIELVVIMPFIVVLIGCIIAVSGLFSTKSRVVGAARDGARALSLRPGVVTPNADPNATDGITVTLDGPACPALSDPAYQTATPPSVTAKATTTYTASIPFLDPFLEPVVDDWPDIPVTEKAIMPCG